MLNDQQAQAAYHEGSPLLILAGAGSGKTHTLTERIAWFVHERQVPAEQILAVTFTNKAAREMRERIAKRLGLAPQDGAALRLGAPNFPLVGTFHSLGVFFLRRYGSSIGIAERFAIADEDDRLKLIKKFLSAKEIDEDILPPKKALGYISRAKNDGIDARTYASLADSREKAWVAEIYPMYEAELAENSLLDFDDILLQFLRLLRSPETLARIQDRYTHFFVDEYQDTNGVQYRIVQALASRTRQITVVGDDAQGIYGWRGANVDNLRSFERDYTDARVVKLEENYRSTQAILEAANALIAKSKENLPKTLWTRNTGGETVKSFSFSGDRQEAEWMTQTIKASGHPGEWAILYRTNGQSRSIEEALVRSGIPYRVFGWPKFYDRKEIKDLLAYARLILNPADTAALGRIINVPSRKIGDKTVSAILSYLRNYSLDFLGFCACLDGADDFTTLQKNAIGGFGEIVSDLCSTLSRATAPDELILAILDRAGYRDYLKSEAKSDDEFESRMENALELANLAARYAGMGTPEECLAAFLSDVALMTDQDESEAADMVSLMTIHLAKGLEFDRVIVAGCEEAILPHSRSLFDTKALEEERRLMYVAVTRARKACFLTRTRERFSFGSYSANPASRFLAEMEWHIEDEIIFDTAGNLYPSRQGNSAYGGASSLSSGSTFGGGMRTTSSVVIPKRTNKPVNDVSLFSVGKRVVHDLFGTGTIVGLTGDVASIAFGASYGVKKLNIKLAPVRPVE